MDGWHKFAEQIGIAIWIHGFAWGIALGALIGGVITWAILT